MIISDPPAVIAYWAREQLREGAPSREVGLKLMALINAAEDLRAAMAPRNDNVVSIDAYRRRAR